MQVPKSGLTLSEISDAFGTTDAAVAGAAFKDTYIVPLKDTQYRCALSACE